MKRAAKAEEEAEEEGEDEPEVVHADVWQKRKGWLLRVPNDVAEKWHDRRRICEEYCALSKEAAQPKSRVTEAQLREKKAMAEQACCITRRHSTKSHTDTFCLQITYEITRAYYLRFPYVTYSL